MKTLFIILLQIGMMDNANLIAPSFFQAQVKPTVPEKQWFNNFLTVPQDKTIFIYNPVLMYQPQLSTLELYFEPMHLPMQRQSSFHNNKYGVVPEGVKLRPRQTRGKRIYRSNPVTKYRGPI
ncbi:hypothetical protein [Fulvivirga kasyanovii]|uniref:Uncharacterized protein n=1 Tax=Fulvivirga kasyanovii TaxID=396812 RepID=A0ABW9RVT1_9BACT|nr:hypothetical protein [Fulvivirga kasyanovii]MTI27110.1 hypothetical protein [Fulvivirga kasyanovii]